MVSKKDYRLVPHTMEQGEVMKVKSLREKFQNDESSKSRFKPAIPEKPKTIPPTSPTAKISNPLIASINSAVENRLVPRVVFKDDKKNRQFPQPETSLIKAKPILLDKNQKKEADLIKQALKDKKIVVPSPGTLVSEQKPKPETVQKSPVLETPVKVPRPIFNKREKDEKEKTSLSKWDLPGVLDHSDSTIYTRAKVEATVNQSVALKAPVSSITANPIISAPVVSPRTISASKPLVLTDPEPVFQNGPQLEQPRPENPIRHNLNVLSQTADIFPHGLPEEAASIPDLPDILDMDIPPPIIPEDFFDGGASLLDISASVTSEHSFPGASLSVNPVPSSSALFRTASPIPTIESPYSDSVFTFSPLPAFSPLPVFSEFPSSVESLAVNKGTESQKAIDHTEKLLEVPLSSSPNPNTVVSALARAEEMAPVKNSSCDRLLTLLEKAKRKSTVGSEYATYDTLPVVETNLPSNDPLESSAHAETSSYVDTPNVLETPLILPDIPPVDYEGKAKVATMTDYNTQPYESALVDEEHGKSSSGPKMVFVQRPLVPPPPPPRKPQSKVTNGGITPEKPLQIPNTDWQSTFLPSQPLEYNEVIIPAPADFISDDSSYEDSEVWNPSEMVGSQAEALDYGNHGPSVHKEAFFKHLNVENQIPSMDTTDNRLPRTSEDLDTVSNSSPFPSGNQINFSSMELEDLPANKKGKTKKQHKGSPMNPYADTPVIFKEEVPRKTLFSKKNSVSDEKELKLKEKQKQKDKEKEKEKKEKEKREQKEKEKEKELKEKEKKDQKEKEKKKELKEKELKEKEKDKKDLKEKEREKKEQKEKEKKENEIKKKFRITGEAEALYQAKVIETTKGRKDDLAIKAGEIVGIIRTTDCPKGKWLARDNTNKYGYIPVESVELNIEEMMGLKHKAANRTTNNGIIETDASTDIRSFQHYSLNQESFEDDSEEWGDDDDTVFPPAHTTNLEINQRVASPHSGSEPVPTLAGHTNRSDNHSGQEALQKLSTFFAQPKAPTLQSDTILLPPPDLYADIVKG